MCALLMPFVAGKNNQTSSKRYKLLHFFSRFSALNYFYDYDRIQ